jgi:hypothetical protein
MRDDGEVFFLRKGVERHPQAETLGERYLLLHRLGRMYLLADVARPLVLVEELRHQMPPVGGRVEEHVVRLGPHRAVEHALEHLVGRLPFLEREIVDEDDETLGPSLEAGEQIGQIDQIGLLHFHQPQPPIGVLGEQRLHEGRLPRATRAREQHVVRRTSGQELLGVAHHARLLRLDVLEIVEPQAMRPPHRLQHAAPAHPPVPVGQALLVGPAQPRRPLVRSQRLERHRQTLERRHQNLHFALVHRFSARKGLSPR